MVYTPEQELIRRAMLEDMANLMKAGQTQEAAGAAVAPVWGGVLTPSNQVPVTPEQTAYEKYIGSETTTNSFTGDPDKDAAIMGLLTTEKGLTPTLNGIPVQYQPSAQDSINPSISTPWGGDIGVPTIDHDMYMESNPFSVFLQHLGTTGLGMTPYEKWYVSQYNPMQAAFGLGLTPFTNWVEALNAGLSPSSSRSMLYNMVVISPAYE